MWADMDNVGRYGSCGQIWIMWADMDNVGRISLLQGRYSFTNEISHVIIYICDGLFDRVIHVWVLRIPP